jgi:hypothetical protein
MAATWGILYQNEERLGSNNQDNLTMALIISEIIVSYLVAFLQYYFVYQMAVVHHTLASIFPEEKAKKLRRLYIVSAIVANLHFFDLATFLAVYLQAQESMSISVTVKEVAVPINITCSILIKGVVFPSGIYYFYSFMTKKKETMRLLRENSGDVNTSVKFKLVCIWSAILLTLNIIKAVSYIIMDVLI